MYRQRWPVRLASLALLISTSASLAPSGLKHPVETSAADVTSGAGPATNPDDLEIIGGSPAEPGEFPFQAQLKIDGNHACGGVLLDAGWVATAAHCLTNPDVTVYEVILGEYDVTIKEGTEQIRNVQQIVFHTAEGSSSPSPGDSAPALRGGDIAMLKLEKPVVLGKYVQPLELPDLKDDFSGKVGFTAGWGVSGSTVISPIYPKVLQKVKMTILTDEVCLKDLVYFNYQADTMSCASAPAESSLCWGDSGGPLVYYKSAESPVMAALTSWGVECSLAQLPTVFVEAAAYVKWISDVMTGHVTSYHQG